MSPKVRKILDVSLLLVLVLWLAFVIFAISFGLAIAGPRSENVAEYLFGKPRAVALIASPLIPLAAWILLVRSRYGH